MLVPARSLVRTMGPPTWPSLKEGEAISISAWNRNLLMCASECVQNHMGKTAQSEWNFAACMKGKVFRCCRGARRPLQCPSGRAGSFAVTECITDEYHATLAKRRGGGVFGEALFLSVYPLSMCQCFDVSIRRVFHLMMARYQDMSYHISRAAICHQDMLPPWVQ
jgi:hypothetical protein